MIYFGMWNNLKFEIKKFSENLIKFGIFYKIWDLGFEEGKFWFFFGMKTKLLVSNVLIESNQFKL